MEIKLNNAALRKIQEQAGKTAAEHLNAALDDVWRTHAGKPKADVYAALAAHPKLRELGTPTETIEGFAEKISNNIRVRART